MEEAIAALLSHSSIDLAAKSIDISPKTLRRWLKIPEFQDAYREARREVVHQTVGRMQQHTGDACRVILRTMADPKEGAALNLKAATHILDYSFKGLEMDKLEDLELRLSELEHAAEEAKTRGKK
jgi:hypothetical protein